MELREATANSNLNLNWLLTIWINVQLALLYQACCSSSVVAANHSVYSSNSNSNWNRPQVKVEVRGRVRSSSAVQQQPPARVAPSGSGSAPAGAVSQPSSSSAAALYHPNHPNTLLANHLLYRQHEQHKYHSRKMVR
ncbi:unnamed protein product, partial [Anisakis simplex]|uniref:Secreted protein n=1 Tax=Anisakis simplex TaxID=6269 RepID=A0A0M3JKC5_ANISI